MSKVEGHFEITNQALNELKAERPSGPILKGVPTVPGRLGRGDLRHFVLGSASIATSRTENPAWGAVYRDLRDIWNGGHWKDSAQKHHFMRRFSGQNSRAAYEEAAAWVRGEAANSARTVASNLKAARQENLFRGRASDHMGNALHALQDSFSASHAVREGLTAAVPGKIAKLYVYAGHEKKDHSHHDKQWGAAGRFTDRGKHAVQATKELLALTIDAALAGKTQLDGWTEFQSRWLATASTIDQQREA